MSGTARAVFLSYRREETRHIAGRLADRLTERLGSTQVFIDVDKIEPGADFAATIVREVASCDVLIALIGPTWSTIADPQGRRRLDDPDDLVILEIRTALERGIRVIPVLVDGAVMPDRHDLPQGLQDLALRNSVRLDYETFRTDIVTLLDAVERVLPAFAQNTAGPTGRAGDRIIDRSRTDPGRPAHQRPGEPARRRWIARLTGSVGLDTSAGRQRTDGDGSRWPGNRRLLVAVIAIVLIASGVLLPMLISSGGSTVQPTATALTISPASRLAQGSLLTLTAAITPAAAAGTVQFMDGSTSLGPPVTVSNGSASGTTSVLAAGSHQLTAVFTPSNPAEFRPSVSPSVTVAVTDAVPPPRPLPLPLAITRSTLTTDPASTLAQGGFVRLTAAITPAAALGTVQFKDGANNLGPPVTVSNGSASGATSELSIGSHQLTAVFTPSDPAAFGPSVSPPLTFIVTA